MVGGYGLASNGPLEDGHAVGKTPAARMPGLHLVERTFLFHR